MVNIHVDCNEDLKKYLEKCEDEYRKSYYHKITISLLENSNHIIDPMNPKILKVHYFSNIDETSWDYIYYDFLIKDRIISEDVSFYESVHIINSDDKEIFDIKIEKKEFKEDSKDINETQVYTCGTKINEFDIRDVYIVPQDGYISWFDHSSSHIFVPKGKKVTFDLGPRNPDKKVIYYNEDAIGINAYSTLFNFTGIINHDDDELILLENIDLRPDIVKSKNNIDNLLKASHPEIEFKS